MSTGSSWQMAFVVRRLGERSALPLAHANRFSSPARKAHHTVAQQEDLITWVQQHGGYVHPSLRLVPSSSGSSGMGLVSIRPVPSGSALISLPPNLPLAFPSPEYVRPNTPDEALLHLAQLVPEELWALKLGLKLLMERAQTGSFWWPYISNLPQRFNIPFFFTGDEIANLQYVPVMYQVALALLYLGMERLTYYIIITSFQCHFNVGVPYELQVKKRCRALLDLAKVVETVLSKLPAAQQPFGGQEVNASSLGWAMAAVSSRAFQVHNPEDSLRELCGKQRVMLPLIDMCNHSFTPNACITQQEEKSGASFVVVAEHNLHAGTNILLSYGSLGNDLLLLDYGFVVPQNPHDYVELRYDKLLLDAARVTARLHAESFAEPTQWQHSILEQLNLEGVGAFLQLKVGGPKFIDGRLLAALRVLYAQNMDSVLNKDLSLLQAWGQAPLGSLIESQVLKTLLAMCALLLGHFPTTIAEDEMTLANEELNGAGRLVLEYRIAKKKLLFDCMQGITQELNHLESTK